ncbi:isochorismatase family cysteine hydrolase [Campylobacter sp. 9BO]|uniref:cysteine hydrolase family protein n=2 Tax=Campylobacter TaxID=194 RepID=UPI003D336E32
MINDEVIDKFYNGLEYIKLGDLNPEKSCFIVVDMINAFCKQGALASTECAQVVPNLATVLSKAKQLGFKNFLFIQDRHDDESLEFDAFPPHALAGSDEENIVDELTQLKLGERVFYKNSFLIAYNADFNKFINDHKEIDTFIIVGCCTDICVFSTVLHLSCLSNEQGKKRKIIIPKSLVATYSSYGHEARIYDYIF